MTACSSLSSVLLTLLPAAAGAVFAFAFAVFLTRRDRQWQRTRDSFAAEMQVVRPLDEALVTTQRHVEGIDVPTDKSKWEIAYEAWRDGWVRLTPQLTSHDVEARCQAVGTILQNVLAHDVEYGQLPARTTALVLRAITNARLALAYWLRGDELPPASFPTSQQTIELLGEGDPTPLDPGEPLWVWLNQHEEPPWRPPPRRRWWQ